MSSLDYLDLCRLCLVKDQVSVPIFDGEGDVRQIFLKIAACLPVKLTRDDKLPKKICNDCVYKVELFYEFWNTTSNSEKQLMQWLGEVDVNDKQTYVTAVINQDQSSDNRLDGNVMQQTNEHQNNMGMNIIETMSLEMPMMMSTDQTQMTINTTNNSNSQSIQALPGTSAQQKDGMGESEEDNSDDDMDRDEGLPVKEEIIQDTNRIIEPGAFLNVSLPCDEPGPSGLQQQKNADIPDMVIGGQTTESDNKAGLLLEIEQTATQLEPVMHSCDKCDMKFASKKRLIRHKVLHNACHLQPNQNVIIITTMDVNNTPVLPTNSQQRMILPKPYTTPSFIKLENVKHEIIASEEVLFENQEIIEEELYDESEIVNEEYLEDEEIIRDDTKSINIKNEEDSSTSTPKRNRDKSISNNTEEEEEEEDDDNNFDEFEDGEIDDDNDDDYDVNEDIDDYPEKKKSKKKKSDNGIIYQCDSCDFECSNKSTLYSHNRKHRPDNKNEETTYSCTQCDFKSTKKVSLASHLKKHKEKPENELHSCSICGYYASKKSTLYSHTRAKHDPRQALKRQEIFKCDEDNCNYTNRSKHELKVHKLRKHSDEYNFPCTQCEKKYKVKGDLTNHIRFDHKETPIVCEVCGKTCRNTHSLFVHQKFAHYKAKFQCTICKRRMVTQENLNEHMFRQHEQKENSTCPVCNKVFPKNSVLKIHMRIHTGDRPYACKICSKAFVRRTALRQHALIHSGFKPYVCDVVVDGVVCGKAFTQKPGLTCHRKTHPGDHPAAPPVFISSFLTKVLDN